MILTSITISVLMWAYPSNPYVWCVLFVLVGYGIVGFVDDYRKVVRKDTKGLDRPLEVFLAVGDCADCRIRHVRRRKRHASHRAGCAVL